MNDYKKLIDEVIQAYNLPKARVEAVLETCLRLGVEPIGNVFLRKAEDVEKMVELFNSKNLNINNYRTVFRKTYADVKEIFDICDENNIIIEPSLLFLHICFLFGIFVLFLFFERKTLWIKNLI